EKADAERYSMLKARQDLQLARAGVRLQTLRVKEAQDGVKLAQIQQQRAQVQVDTYQYWLDAGPLAAEFAEATLLTVSAGLQTAAGSANLTKLGGPDVGGALSSFAASASTSASINALWASYDRKAEEWTLQKTLAQQDVLIAGQQITIADDNVRVAD